MSNNWQGAYKELQNFISANPSIRISTNVIVILGDVRPEFYRLFDAARIAFVEEKAPVGLLEEAKTLSENYTKAEQEIKELLKLDNIFLQPSLDRFLHDPPTWFIRDLFDPLFDLLKGQISFEMFERKALKDIEATFDGLYGLGYAKWVALSLVKLLAADKLFDITPPESRVDGHGEPSKLFYKEAVPSPKESRDLSFEYGPHQYPTFIMPNFIVHAAKLNRYVSIRTELWARAVYKALDASEKREWLDLDSMAAEFHHAETDPALLIYTDDRPEELVVIADMNRISRPDLVVECRVPKDWRDKEALAKKTKLFDSLNPVLGRYIVSRESVPEQVPEKPTAEQESEKQGAGTTILTAGADQSTREFVPEQVSEKPTAEQGSEKQGAGTTILTAGFDQSKLEPIIEAIVNSASRDSAKKGELAQ